MLRTPVGRNRGLGSRLQDGVRVVLSMTLFFHRSQVENFAYERPVEMGHIWGRSSHRPERSRRRAALRVASLSQERALKPNGRFLRRRSKRADGRD